MSSNEDSIVQLKRQRLSIDEEVKENCLSIDEILESDIPTEIDVELVKRNLCDIKKRNAELEEITAVLVEKLIADKQDTSSVHKASRITDKMVKSTLVRAERLLKSRAEMQQKQILQEKAESLQQQLNELQASMSSINVNPSYTSPSSLSRDDSTEMNDTCHATNTTDSQLSATLIKFLSGVALDVPKPELVKFDGRQENYSKFVCSFDNNISNKPIDGRTKLNYLIQLVGEDARRIVEPYLFINGEEGYLRARQALDRRFGKSHKIVKVHLDKIIKGCPLKPGCKTDHVRFLEDLHSTKVTLESMGKSKELDCDNVMQSLVGRIPVGLRRKWVSKSVQIAKIHGREGRFDEFLSWMEDIGEEYDSIYNTEVFDTKKSGISHMVNYLKEGDIKSLKCIYCNGDCKSISECCDFKKLTVRDRLVIVRKLNLCMFCLNSGHLVRSCRKASQCTAEGCKFTHHYLLHDWSRVTPTGSHMPQNGKGGVHCTSTGAMNTSQNQKVSLAIVPITVRGTGGKSVDTFALLDSGSDVSLVDQGLLKDLNIKGKKRSYTITTVNEADKVQHGMEVYLDVKSFYGGSFTRISRLWSVKHLPVSLNGLPQTEELRKFQHLKGIKIPPVEGKKVSILIGSDMPELVCPYEVRRGRPGQPCAMRSKLGWVVLGKLPADNFYINRGQTHFVQERGLRELDLQVRKMWETDYNEKSADIKCMSQVDKMVLSQIEESTNINSGHYEISLPFKKEVNVLPNDYFMAVKRLQNLKSKLEKDSALKTMYTQAMNKYIEDGHAIKVSDSESHSGQPMTWYIPHQPVVNENKPGKVRVVFDCAARFKSTSLNDMLESGPDLVNSLVGVLLRFRQDKIAIASDVQAMFHQVKVPPNDQHSLRFLWYEDGDLSRQPSVYCMTVHLFGAKSSPTCAAFALRKAATDQVNEFSTEAIQTVLNNFYVDDCLKSVGTEIEAVKLVKELKNLLANRGFNLTKWVSNSESVLKEIPEDDQAPGAQLSLDGEGLERTLGVKWNVNEDAFTFEVRLKEKPITKRGILSTVSSIFDPLGFVAPMTLGAKKLIQDLTRLNVEWDANVPGEIKGQWVQWLENLQQITGIKVRRCLKPEGINKPDNIQLHVFADASEVGYGVVAYLRCVTAGEVTCRLVMGKARLAPVKRVSIPRLELMAAVLASKVKCLVENELELSINSVVMWTDSTIVLAYIRNTISRFKTFVANRLVEIHDRTDVNQWRHVPGLLNPADLASRGFVACEVSKLKVWLNGPRFLTEDQENWPSDANKLSVDASELEVSNTLNVNVIRSTVVGGYFSYLWDRYSSLLKLKKVVAQCLRFKNNLMAKCGLRGKLMVDSSIRLSVQELELAETAIIKNVQQEVYAEELSSLSQGKQIKVNSCIARLNPKLHNGLLKLNGRIYSSIEASPCILPGKHSVAKLIIMHAHNEVGHLGYSSTLALIREKFWLTKGIASVRSVLSKCLLCKRKNSRPIQPVMASLPEVRIEPNQPPFSNIGLDFFGPLLVRQRRSTVKRYGMIFVCMTTRAIHLEVTHSLDTNSVLMGLSRFAARRGKPNSIFCDNWTSLIKTDKVLTEELNKLQKCKIYEDCLNKGISFVYRPPFCSSMGGVYERMIRSVRSVLFSLCQQQTLDDERLSTFMVQVERILNSRPITQINSGLSDPSPLTPNMLLLFRSNLPIPEAVCNSGENYCKRRWAQIQYMSDIFWKRWIKEYLPTLALRQKWLKGKLSVKKGDLVLLREPNCSRGMWPMALVEETMTSHDGIVRSCIVKRGKSKLKRALSSLCMLEAC